MSRQPIIRQPAELHPWSAGALPLSTDDATLATEGDAGFTNVSVTVRLSHSSVRARE